MIGCARDRVQMMDESLTIESGRGENRTDHFPARNRLLVLVSLCLQLALATFLGHAYDMRIFMSTG